MCNNYCLETGDYYKRILDLASGSELEGGIVANAGWTNVIFKWWSTCGTWLNYWPGWWWWITVD